MKKKVLISIILSIAIALASCSAADAKKERIFPAESEATPKTITLGRNAKGAEAVGTEKDSVSFSLPADSGDGALIAEFLSYFYYGTEKDPEYITDDVEYTFALEYADGTVRESSLKYTENDGGAFIVDIAPEAATHPGYEAWRTQMENALTADADYTPITYILSGEHAVCYDSAVSRYYTGVKSEVLASLTRKDMGILLRDEAGGCRPTVVFTNDPLMVPSRKGEEMFTVGFDKTRIEVKNTVTDHTLTYRAVALPELQINDRTGKCTVVYPDPHFNSALLAEYEELVVNKVPEGKSYTLPIDPTTLEGYDWEGHIFPPEKTEDIVKIEYIRRATGDAATGVDAIDNVRVDIATVVETNTDDTFALGKQWLRSLTYGNPVMPEEHDVEYSFALTYSDGRVEEHDGRYAERDGITYELISHPRMQQGYGIFHSALWYLAAHQEQTNAAPIMSISSHIEEAGIENWTLVSGGESYTVTDDSYLIHTATGFPDYTFTEEVAKPATLPDEVLIITHPENANELRLYPDEAGTIEWTENGVTRYFRSKNLSCATTPAMDLIDAFKQNYANLPITVTAEDGESAAYAYALEAFPRACLDYPFEHCRIERYTAYELLELSIEEESEDGVRFSMHYTLKPETAKALCTDHGDINFDGLRERTRYVTLYRLSDGSWSDRKPS